MHSKPAMPKLIYCFAAILLCSCIAIVLWRGQAQGQPKQDGPQPVNCVEWNKEVRPRGYGYMHVVKLNNQCNTSQRCDVSTNSNPEKQTVELPPKGSREVIAHISSPAREFTASVNCRASQP